jgi:hypothetical protein
MPQLTKMVNKLKGLAKTATYTRTGIVKNATLREFGFAVPEGAVDRADYIATVSNQVLPLLKQTFGAAFTASEGDALKATLGDPNLSPVEKFAQLDAFIDQKKQQTMTSYKTYQTLENERKIREKQQEIIQPTEGEAQRETQTPQTQNDQALKWLLDNPNDPRAPAVRQKLGI